MKMAGCIYSKITAVAERNDLIASIAETTSDYGKAEGEGPTPERINRWINQFDATVQLQILQEMDYVLKKTYFSLTYTTQFLAELFKNRKSGRRQSLRLLE